MHWFSDDCSGAWICQEALQHCSSIDQTLTSWQVPAALFPSESTSVPQYASENELAFSGSFAVQAAVPHSTAPVLDFVRSAQSESAVAQT